MKPIIVALSALSILLAGCRGRDASPPAGPPDVERVRLSEDMRGLIKRQVDRYEELVGDTLRAAEQTSDTGAMLVLRQIEVSLIRIQFATAGLMTLEEVYLACPLDQAGTRKAMEAEYAYISGLAEATAKTMTGVAALAAESPALRAASEPITTTALAVLDSHRKALEVRHQVLASARARVLKPPWTGQTPATATGASSATAAGTRRGRGGSTARSSPTRHPRAAGQPPHARRLASAEALPPALSRSRRRCPPQPTWARTSKTPCALPAT